MEGNWNNLERHGKCLEQGDTQNKITLEEELGATYLVTSLIKIGQLSAISSLHRSLPALLSPVIKTHTEGFWERNGEGEKTECHRYYIDNAA